MKNKNDVYQKDFIYKFIKYSDNEVISKIKKIEEINSNAISHNVNKITHLYLFV